jgi:hypothetical protein
MVSLAMMAGISSSYIHFRKNIDFLTTKQNVYHITYWRISFYFHVFASLLVLPAGFSQFNKKLILERPNLHRRLGIVYLITVITIASPTGFLMSIHANGGLAARTSFLSLSLAWFISALLAWRYALKRKFILHGEWVLRSYALALSAITLRLYALLFDLLHLDFPPRDVYITIAWMSWVPNLIIAELMIRNNFIINRLKK